MNGERAHNDEIMLNINNNHHDVILIIKLGDFHEK